MSESEFLLINNNNSRTKFALANRNALLDEHRVIDTEDLTKAGVQELLEGWNFSKIIMASVVPDRADDLRGWFSATPMVEVSHRVELGIEVDFPNPATIGADRLANAAAVSEPMIVVDFGTAVTFDIISRQSDEAPLAYIGGVIAPGLDAMRNYLHQRTALLPEIDLREPPTAIGKSTEDAMLSGAVYGYRGLVREILAQIKNELNHDTKIVATGGYAELIAAGMPEIERVEPFLTMEGLRLIGNLNFKK